MKADLHVHTTISDGTFNAIETIEMAKKRGVTHLGIVNHDTVEGLQEIIELGKENGIKVIPGIEISAYDYERNRKVHLLGYNFNLDGKNIKKLCDPMLKKREENTRWQIKRIIEEGYEIEEDFIELISEESTSLYKQHIMEALMKNHYTDSIYSTLYYRLFKNGGICSRDIKYVDVFDALKAIKSDGGQVVLAHPGQLNSYELIPELVEAGLDGIEINHHSHGIQDFIKINELREIYNLFLTGGTDYHGYYGSVEIEIGDLHCPTEFLHYLTSE